MPEPIREISQPTWGDPDVGALERLTAALGEGGVLTHKIDRDELTIVVARRPLGRDGDVHARRRGLRLPVRRRDRRLARLRRRRRRLLGHERLRRPRHEPRRLVGQRGRAEAARRQALHRLHAPAQADDGRAGRAPPVRIQAWLDDGEEIADADPGLPVRRLPRARGVRHDGRRLHGPPEPRPHPASRLLGRPPASQGLRRSAASPCSSRTRSDGGDEAPQAGLADAADPARRRRR